MHNNTRFALAAASALIFSGCTATVWQPMPGHPADPAAEAGTDVPISALSRYRKEIQPPQAAPEDKSGNGSQQDMDHGEDHQ